ncbi:hypothetical protein [Bradyrhizobium sp. B120]|uniref:hypothetical protein n=1 Tax=Bradyrhizobium sp. B120 TaxID=3410088 RepID=UPI003B988095
MMRKGVLPGAVAGLFCMLVAAQAADQTTDPAREMPKKAVTLKAPPPAEKPFFLVNDNRVTVSQFSGGVPGYAKNSQSSTLAYTHYDTWAYGSNSFSLLTSKYDHGAATAPCLGSVLAPTGLCAGGVAASASIRSTFGWNELFDTNAFSVGPLTNISFLVGADASLSNIFTASSNYDVLAGLQFGFSLPYKGYFNVSPMYFQRMQHGAQLMPPSFGGPVSMPPPYPGLPDGVMHFSPTWGLDFNYYMDLGFLPETLQYFSISGRAAIRGADGNGGYGPYPRSPLSNRTTGYALEPVRLTLDAGKLFWGASYAHLVDVWAAWRYEKNIGGYAEAYDTSCITKGVYNGSCSSNGIYYGMTVKLGAPVPGTPALSPFGTPFFTSVDNSFTYGVLPSATAPGETARTVKQVYAFTHTDSWAYGTNRLYAELLKSDHRDPASPCSAVYSHPAFGATAPCSGNMEINASLRSTVGFNEVFNTTAFRAGALRNVSFEIGADGRTTLGYAAPAKEAIVAGLQFAFDLPFKSYLTIAPLYYQEWNHSAYAVPNNAGNSPYGVGLYGVPPYKGLMPAGFTGTIDGNLHYDPTWAVEIDYGSALDFLPEGLRYFSVSGHVGIYGPKGNGAYGGYTLPSSWNTKTEINAEPVRLSFDASKALWGAKYAHFVEAFVAYRYWHNKFGLDGSNAANGICFFANGTSNKSCTEQTVYTGVTMKF